MVRLVHYAELDYDQPPFLCLVTSLQFITLLKGYIHPQLLLWIFISIKDNMYVKN